MMGKTYCVYMHTSPSGKVYIGITCKKPQDRWNHGRAYYQNKHFSNAIQHYGWDNFQHDILLTGLTKEEACSKERELIATYRSNLPKFGYNNSAGGENPNEGAIVSKETRLKHSLAMKGRKLSREHSLAISKAKKGKTNGLLGRTGKACSKAGVICQIDERTGNVVHEYYGYDEMNRITGYAKTPVREASKGIRKRAYGYLWQYKKRGVTDVAI